MSEKLKITAREIALIGMMVAVIEVCKAAIGFLPNIELTTFWLILFTLYFGRKVLFVIPVFILIEGSIYGFGIWWVMYLYLWPLLVLLVWMLRKQESVWVFSILAGLFGLFFGFLGAIPYVVIGAADGGFSNGLAAGFGWWIAGIPWDIVHGVSNFVIMLVLYKPVQKVMQKFKSEV